MHTERKKLQLAQSASALGAAILGFGVGALWGQIISSTILVITMMAGAVLHVAGMYIVQMKNVNKDASGVAKLLWISAWVCLLALVTLFIYLLITRS